MARDKRGRLDQEAGDHLNALLDSIKKPEIETKKEDSTIINKEEIQSSGLLGRLIGK